MNDKETLVQVEILGRTYTLRGGDDPQSVKDLAAYVDTRMAEMAEQTNTVDTTRIAILAALNIADELFKGRQGGNGVSQPLGKQRRDKKLCRMLDEVLLP